MIKMYKHANAIDTAELRSANTSGLSRHQSD